MSGEGTNGVRKPVERDRVACVLLHAPGAAVPTALLASLSKRIGRIESFTDSYLALAEACANAAPSVVLLLVEPSNLPEAEEVVAAARLYAPRATIWYHTQQRGLVKLGTQDRLPEPPRPQPSTPPTGPRLAATFGPDTPRLKPGGAPAFRPAPKTARASNEQSRVVVRPGGGIAPRRLRLVGDVPPQQASGVNGKAMTPQVCGQTGTEAGEAGQAQTAPLLTEEELRMLLGDSGPGTNGQERSKG